MVAALAEDLKTRFIPWYFDEGLTMKQIATRAQCSISTVWVTIDNYRRYGQVTNPYGSRLGRECILDYADAAYVRHLVDANPSIYLDELQEKLAVMRNLHVSIATISRSLRHLDLTHKAVTAAASERDEDLRDLWQLRMAAYRNPDLFVFLDESSVDQLTGHRTFGWAPRGAPCVRRQTFIRGTRYSMLPALASTGIIALDIIEGSVTKDIFLDFLREKVVCLCHPHYPGMTAHYQVHSSGAPTQPISRRWFEQAQHCCLGQLRYPPR